MYKTLSLLPILILISQIALASPGEGGGHHKNGGMKMALKNLDLSEEQQKSIKTIHTEFKESIKALRAKAHEAREKFHEAMANSKLSNEELTKLHEEMIDSKTGMMRAKFQKMLKLRALLDDKQREKFQSLMEKREKGKRFKEKWGGKGRHNFMEDEPEDSENED